MQEVEIMTADGWQRAHGPWRVGGGKLLMGTIGSESVWPHEWRYVDVPHEMGDKRTAPIVIRGVSTRDVFRGPEGNLYTVAGLIDDPCMILEPLNGQGDRQVIVINSPLFREYEHLIPVATDRTADGGYLRVE